MTEQDKVNPSDGKEHETTAEAQPEQEAPQKDQPQGHDTEKEELRNKYLYLLSDFENFKRHAAKERMELIQTAGRDIMALLLPVLDDFDRAANNGNMPEGIGLIHHKLIHTLESKGLKKMETRIGDAFDENFHDAVAELPSADEEGKGKIIDIVEPGYKLGERIIRFAKVVVGR